MQDSYRDRLRIEQLPMAQLTSIVSNAWYEKKRDTESFMLISRAESEPKPVNREAYAAMRLATWRSYQDRWESAQKVKQTAKR